MKAVQLIISHPESVQNTLRQISVIILTVTKRSMDAVICGIGLIFLSPLLLAIVVAILRESKKPSFFKKAKVWSRLIKLVNKDDPKGRLDNNKASS